MGIKDLFNEDAETKVVSLTNMSSAAEDVESVNYYSAQVTQKNKFEPHIDYTSASNFAKFGSAEKYYHDSISNIYTYYPFDGSFFERTEWEISASGIQKYIFDNEYPRTNGFIDFSHGIWGGTAATISAPLYALPDDIEYILIKGGPNKDPDGTGKSLASIFAASSSNFYDATENRESNLEMGLGGNTVEWWMKKEGFVAAGQREVIFDLWASGSTHGTPNNGELSIYLNDAANPLAVSYLSGTAGIGSTFSGPGAPTNASITDGKWHHYAISFTNQPAVATLYVDGVYADQTSSGGTWTGPVTGAMMATIGSYFNSEGSFGTALTPTTPGWCKLSASLDEFRFWKTARTDKQIGQYWFTQVGGGTNQDDANTDLGVYYKFNEGISLTASIAARVLDYSGRFSDGDWIGYTAGARHTGSAMVLAGAAKSEFKDPIIYPSNPDVASLMTTKTAIGKEYDFHNAASIYNSIPDWIMNEDDGNLKNLTQIVSTFFDSLQLKTEELSRLRDVQYLSSSVKPYPFTKNALESLGFSTPDLFIQADVLEAIADRSNTELYDEKIYNIKNLIYQNIYNNLSYIYNTKGTMKSFRNLLRCYGIDEELIRVNLYVDGQTFKLEDDYKLMALEKKFVNFASTDRFNGTVYMTASNSTESDYFPAPALSNRPHDMTYETEIVVPSKFPRDSTLWFDTPFISASLFGQHQVEADHYTWSTLAQDQAEFQVYLVKEELESSNAKFVLTTVGAFSLPTLESPTFKDVYDNTNWNIAVKVKRNYSLHDEGTPWPATAYTGIVEFQGVQSEGDFIRNEFTVTSSLTAAKFARFIDNPRKFYAGAHYTNFTGSIREQTDVKITNNRVWLSYLPAEVMRVHAKDTTNYGTKNPYENAFASLTASVYDVAIPEIDTNALFWGYDNLSSSDGGSGPGYTAGFNVTDLHTSSAGRDYGRLGVMLTSSHPGRGDFFLANDDDVIQKEYLSNAKLQGPETVQSDDLVEIISNADEEIFTRESRPLDYVYALEKGMQQVISDEMINVFGGIVEFNNLIGAPVNRYRQNYDEMGKLREIFFSRIKNTPSLIKYVEFYKWIDGAINSMVRQLVPATANFADKVATVVESHILERNKHWNKFPTVELELEPPEGPMRGGAERRYPWSIGHAPLPESPLPQNENCYWWKYRADGSDAAGYIPSGIFMNREGIISASHSTFDRQFNGVAVVKGNVVENTDEGVIKLDITRQTTKFGTDGYLSLSTGSFEEVDCLDES